MRKLLTALVVLALLLVVADVGLRAYAESRTADAIAAEFDAAVKPDVSIEGFPFLWGAIRGRYPQVVITDSRVDVAGVAGVRATLTLTGVTLPLSDALARDVSNLAAEAADLQAMVPLESLAAALGRPNLTLAGTPDGSLLVSATINVVGQDIPVSGTGTVTVVDDVLTISVAELRAAGVDITPVVAAATAALAAELSLSVPLRGLPFTVTGATATVEGSDLVLTASTGAFLFTDLQRGPPA